jgi:hypothetical protein
MTEQDNGSKKTYSLAEWLQELSHGLGLRDSGIKRKLGQGLARLLEVDSKTTPSQATERAIAFFSELLNGVKNPAHRLAGQVSLYTVDWPELSGKILKHRRDWLASGSKADSWSGSAEKKVKPVLSVNTGRDYMRTKVFPYLEEEILARWRQKFPNEPFPLEKKSTSNKDTNRQSERQPSTSQSKQIPYVSPPVVPRDIDFVPRPTYDSEFATRMAHGDRVIPFVGEPGNGKSRLADWLIEQHRQTYERRIDLRANTRVSLHTDLKVQLERRGISTLYLSDDQIIEQFALWLCAQDAPDIVFIDNLEDNNLFERLVLRDSSARVVVTSRESRVPAHVATPIVVHAMEPAEAQQLVRRVLPDHDESDITRLATELGSRPLAIVHASTGLLADGFMTVGQFCQAFERDAGSIMQRTQRPEDAELTLTWIYRRILERLHQLEDDSTIAVATLLKFVTFVAPTEIPVELLTGAIKQYWSIESDVDLAAIFQPAQRELCARYLLTRVETSAKVTFSIHPLTQTLLRSILVKQGKELSLCLCLHRPVQELLAPEQDDHASRYTATISDHVLSWLPHIYYIIRGLLDLDDETYQKMDIGHTVAVLIRGFRNVGDARAAQQAATFHLAIREPDQWPRTPYLYEAYLAYARLRYDLAQVSSSEYMHMQQQALLCLPDSTRVAGKKVGPRPMQMLEYIEAALEISDCEAALDLVGSFERWYRASIPPAVMIYKLVLLAEIFHQQCKWQDSTNLLNAARELRNNVGFDEWRFKRDDMRALVTLIENELLRGNQEQAAHYEEIADAVWAEKPEGLTDSLTEARYHYIKARCALTAFVRAQVAVKRDGANEDLEVCRTLVERAAAHIAASSKAYAKIGSVRETYRFFGDTITMYFLIGGKAGVQACVDYINKWYDVARERGPYRMVPHFVLTVEKLWLLPPSHPEPPEYWLRGLEKLAVTMGSGSESPYIYAEFLALSSVYDQLLGSPNQAKLRVIKETYESIDRPDRFAALEAALARLPDDKQGFARQFIYLLLP